MDPYERMIEIMRRQGKKYNPPAPEIGIMEEEGKVRLNDLLLDTDDYLIDCNLRLDKTKKVYYHKGEPSGGGYLTTSDHNAELEEYKKNLLQTGDRVLMLKIENDDAEQYILLAKVVIPE